MVVLIVYARDDREHFLVIFDLRLHER